MPYAHWHEAPDDVAFVIALALLAYSAGHFVTPGLRLSTRALAGFATVAALFLLVVIAGHMSLPRDAAASFILFVFGSQAALSFAVVIELGRTDSLRR